VEKLEFDLPSLVDCEALGLGGTVSCADSDRARVDGPFEVDLVNASLSPELDDMTLPAITFDRIDATFATMDEDLASSLDDPMIGKTIIASGEFSHDGSDYTFQVDLAFDDEIPFESASGLELEDNSILKMLFNVRYWFADASISDCIENGDLEIVDEHLQITDDCPGVLGDIEAAIKDSAYLDME